MTFEVPFTAEEMNSTNSTDTQLRDFTVILQDSSQVLKYMCNLICVCSHMVSNRDLESILLDLSQMKNYKLSNLLPIVNFMQCFPQVVDSFLQFLFLSSFAFTTAKCTKDLWLVNPVISIGNLQVYFILAPLTLKVKKICWKIQDMIPKSKSKAQNSFSMKKHGALLCFILIARIIKMLTFSFTVITLIYLRINYEQFQIMKGVSEDYRFVFETKV